MTCMGPSVCCLDGHGGFGDAWTTIRSFPGNVAGQP